MTDRPFALPDSWRDGLARLAGRPAAFACVLLAVNALCHPYLGLFHDARLYAAQLAERHQPGTLSLDLYLRYGSQDSYSIFSALLLPLVGLIGLEPAFFVAYLASKAAFFFALARLVPRLLGDPLAAALSLLFLSMAPLPFGGNDVIQLNESFLTPRIAGCSLVLFALERALAGRPAQAAALTASALAVHPLMAFGGALVFLLWALFARASWRALAVAGVAVALFGLASLCEPLGRRAFGQLDEQWRSVVYHVCFFVDPATWTFADWLRIAAAAASAVAFVRLCGRERGPLVAALIAAGVMGVVGNAVASTFHYRLLIQASPYRTLWLLESLAVPFATAVAVRLWATRHGPLVAVALVAAMTADWNALLPHPLFWFALAALPAVLWARGLGRTPAEGWPARAAALALAGGVGLLAFADVAMLATVLRREATPDSDVHPVRVAQLACGLLYKLPLVALASALAARAASGWRLAAGLAAVWLAYQGGVAWLDASDAYQARFSPQQRHVQFVRDVLRERGESLGRTPTVYWATDDLRDVWFRGEASAYFHSVQLSGCAFNRGTAIEGRRRADLVRAFEVEQLRRRPLPTRWWQEALEGLYGAPQVGEPALADLLALCADEGVDFVAVPTRFEGLYCATDGAYYVYDAAEVRRR